MFSRTTGIIKKLLSITRNKNKKHDKIFILAKSKLNSIETLIFQALVDMEISHEEFVAIFKEKDTYEKMRENVKDVSERSSAEKQENMRLDSVILKTIKNYWAFYVLKKNYFFVCTCINWLILALKHGIKLKFL